MAVPREAVFHLMNELFDSSSESSDEELEIIAAMKKTAGSSTLWSGERRPRVENYVEMTVQLYSSWEFKSHFRLHKETFYYILDIIAPHISAQDGLGPCRPTIAPVKQLLIALWILATPDSYRSVCDRFDVGNATAMRSVRRVVDALFTIAPTIIKWPSGNRVGEVTDGFKAAQSFPGVIGAIDGTFINIPAPRLHHESYINRKSVHAVILQAVCDFEGIFTHVYAGEVGSVHDARVLRKSEVLDYMLHDADIKFPQDTHIIGDPAYPCMKHLLVAYKNNGHLTRRQRNYNFALSATRTIIERTFAYLKGRFRRLKYLDMNRIDLIPRFIVACCVLHNVCQSRHDTIEETDLEFGVEQGDEPEEENDGGTARLNLLKAVGNAKRLEIMDMLPMGQRE